METALYETSVSGMTCRPCEDTILEAVLAAPGVVRGEVSYWKSSVRITYDPALTTQEALGALLTQIGYAPCPKSRGGVMTEALTLAAAVGMVLLLSWLPLPEIPQVEQGASLLFLLVAGLMTGTHCICMCGGILLAQTGTQDLQGRKQPVAHAFARYQGGRLLISLLLGLIFGALGQVLTFSPKLKSMIYTLCGLAVLFIGLCAWGVFPGLRRIRAQLPGVCRLPASWRRHGGGKPFVVGILNGLLPCAASGTMWLYAAACGSAVKGGVSMVIWCLGTLPVMGVFSLLGRTLPPKAMGVFHRFMVVMMLATGLRMAVKGIGMML